MWPCTKCISHPSSVITFFPTPPIKLKPGLQICGGRLLVANPPDPIKRLSSSINSRCYALVYLSPASANCESWAKSVFPEPNRHVLNFSSSHFLFQGHWAPVELHLAVENWKYSCSTATTTTTVIILLWCRQFIHNPTTVLTASISLPLSLLCVSVCS